MKKCWKCNQTKSLICFYKNKSRHDGLSEACAECDNQLSKEYYIKNKDSILIRTRKTNKKRYLLMKKDLLLKHLEYRINWRIKVIGHLGGICSKCKFSDIRALQIDHVNGEGIIDRNGKTVEFYKRVIEDKEGKYQLLCANCNMIKRIENHEHKKNTIIYG